LAQKQECLKTGRTYDEKNGYIFANILGNPADRSNIARAYRSLCKKAGIEPRGIHTLRHTFATRCVELGFDVKSLSEILGHANVNITLNRYVHPSMKLKHANMNKLNSFICSQNSYLGDAE
ncbi:MAG: tyrosine-type recombinase/integrase, partial [Synergistaceae bacterium]|nr:tyrosine-type recombinase/integrase [Synergistaceae bacterium]